MFCSKCGNSVAECVNFCANCGVPIIPFRPVDSADVPKVAKTRSPWLVWITFFVPAFILAKIAMIHYGFYAVFPVILLGAIAILLYQRKVNKRSWRSILYGDNNK